MAPNSWHQQRLLPRAVNGVATTSIVLIAVAGVCILLTLGVGTAMALLYRRSRKRQQQLETLLQEQEAQKRAQSMAEMSPRRPTQRLFQHEQERPTDFIAATRERTQNDSSPEEVNGYNPLRRPRNTYTSIDSNPSVRAASQVEPPNVTAYSGPRANRIRPNPPRDPIQTSNSERQLNARRTRNGSSVEASPPEEQFPEQRNLSRRSNEDASTSILEQQGEALPGPGLTPYLESDRSAAQVSRAPSNLANYTSNNNSTVTFNTAEGGSEQPETGKSPAVSHTSPNAEGSDMESAYGSTRQSPWVTQKPSAASLGQSPRQVPIQEGNRGAPGNEGSAPRRLYSPSADPHRTALAALLSGLGDLPEGHEASAVTGRDMHDELARRSFERPMQRNAGLGIENVMKGEAPVMRQQFSSGALRQGAKPSGRRVSEENERTSFQLHRPMLEDLREASERTRHDTPTTGQPTRVLSSYSPRQSTARQESKDVSPTTSLDKVPPKGASTEAPVGQMLRSARQSVEQLRASPSAPIRRDSSQFNVRRKPVDGSDQADSGSSNAHQQRITPPADQAQSVQESPFNHPAFLPEDPLVLGSSKAKARSQASTKLESGSQQETNYERARASSPTLLGLPRPPPQQPVPPIPAESDMLSTRQDSLPVPGQFNPGSSANDPHGAMNTDGASRGAMPSMPLRDLSQTSSLFNASNSFGPGTETWSISTQQPNAQTPQFVRPPSTQSEASSYEGSFMSSTRASRGSEQAATRDNTVDATQAGDVTIEAVSVDGEREDAMPQEQKQAEEEAPRPDISDRSDFSSRLRAAAREAMSKTSSQQGQAVSRSTSSSSVPALSPVSAGPSLPEMVDPSNNGLALHELLRTSTPSQSSIAGSEDQSGEMDTSMMDDMLQELTVEHDRSQQEIRRRESMIDSKHGSMATLRRMSVVPLGGLAQPAEQMDPKSPVESGVETTQSPRIPGVLRPSDMSGNGAARSDTRQGGSKLQTLLTSPQALPAQPHLRRESSQGTVLPEGARDSSPRIYQGMNYNTLHRQVSPSQSPRSESQATVPRISPQKQGRVLGYPTPPWTPYELTKSLSPGKTNDLQLQTPLLQSAIPEDDNVDTPRASTDLRTEQARQAPAPQGMSVPPQRSQAAEKDNVAATLPEKPAPSSYLSGIGGRVASSLLFQPVSLGYKPADENSRQFGSQSFISYLTGSQPSTTPSEPPEILPYANFPPGSQAFAEHQAAARRAQAAKYEPKPKTAARPGARAQVDTWKTAQGSGPQRPQRPSASAAPRQEHPTVRATRLERASSIISGGDVPALQRAGSKGKAPERPQQTLARTPSASQASRQQYFQQVQRANAGQPEGNDVQRHSGASSSAGPSQPTASASGSFGNYASPSFTMPTFSSSSQGRRASGEISPHSAFGAYPESSSSNAGDPLTPMPSRPPAHATRQQLPPSQRVARPDPSESSIPSSKSRLEMMGFADPGLPQRPSEYSYPAVDTDRSLQQMLRAGKPVRRRA